MRRAYIWILAGFLVVAQGCESNPDSAPIQPANTSTFGSADHATTLPADAAESGPPLAHISGRPIPRSQVVDPLIKGYGLNMLINIVQLEYAKQQAARTNIVVTPDDIQRERQRLFVKNFPDADKSDYEAYFTKFLEQQRVSRIEVEIGFETNAYLRKLAEPMVQAAITDAALEEAFRQQYGETVLVRHIQLTNMTEVLEAKRRLAAGEPFEKVAQEMSRNPYNAKLGGELPAFSRQAAYPQSFKDVAFGLKEGEVSDAVSADGALHLIKLEKRLAPKAVKFEDVKQSIREDLTERAVSETILQLRKQYLSDAMAVLVIDDPVLRQQLKDKLENRDQQVTNKNEVKEQFERERKAILDRATTQQSSTTLPTASPVDSMSAPTSLP